MSTEYVPSGSSFLKYTRRLNADGPMSRLCRPMNIWYDVGPVALFGKLYGVVMYSGAIGRHGSADSGCIFIVTGFHSYGTT